MTLVIKNVNGRWLCNDKPYSDLTFSEKVFFDEFLAATRLEKLVKP